MSLPKSYEDWRHCIEVDCRQPLTADYITTRLAALRDARDPHTRQFLERYGEARLTATISWFERAAKNPTPTPAAADRTTA